MSDKQREPDIQIGRRFAVCDAHRACIDPHDREPCEICTLLGQKADLLAALEKYGQHSDDDCDICTHDRQVQLNVKAIARVCNCGLTAAKTKAKPEGGGT